MSLGKLWKTWRNPWKIYAKPWEEIHHEHQQKQ